MSYMTQCIKMSCDLVHQHIIFLSIFMTIHHLLLLDEPPLKGDFWVVMCFTVNENCA